jgi:lysozyme
MTPRHQASRAALELIKRFEGYRRKAARLADGRWTIGYGHTLTAREGAEVSEDDAEALLLYDVRPVAAAVNEWTYTPLTQNQFDALLAFAFNVGIENFRRSSVLRRVNEGALIQAACALEMWRKADFEGERIVVDALVRRRAAEKALFLTPSDGWVPAPSPVLRPRVDYDVGHALPNNPTQLQTSMTGDKAEAHRVDAAPPQADAAASRAAAPSLAEAEAGLDLTPPPAAVEPADGPASPLAEAEPHPEPEAHAGSEPHAGPATPVEPAPPAHPVETASSYVAEAAVAAVTMHQGMNLTSEPETFEEPAVPAMPAPEPELHPALQSELAAAPVPEIPAIESPAPQADEAPDPASARASDPAAEAPFQFLDSRFDIPDRAPETMTNLSRRVVWREAPMETEASRLLGADGLGRLSPLVLLALFVAGLAVFSAGIVWGLNTRGSGWISWALGLVGIVCVVSSIYVYLDRLSEREE